MAWISPRCTSRLTSASALTPGNSLVMERIESIVVFIAMPWIVGLVPCVLVGLVPGGGGACVPAAATRGGSLLQLVGLVVAGLGEDVDRVALVDVDRLEEL